MADKGLATQKAFPTLSFRGFANFTPILFCLSESRLSASKGWNHFVWLFWGREAGWGLQICQQLLHKACFIGEGWAFIFLSLVGLAFVVFCLGLEWKYG